MKNILVLIAVVLTTTASKGQLLVDFSTDYNMSEDVPVYVQRLYLDETERTLAPVGTKLWFVADVTGNGAPSGQVTEAQIQSISSGTGDVRLFHTDTVDGALLSDQAGMFKRRITVPAAYETFKIGLLLWNDANQDATIGNAGDTFGYYSFGLVPTVQFGTPELLISADVFADQSLITPVPEPAQVGVAFGTLALLGALVRRVVRRKDNASLVRRPV